MLDVSPARRRFGIVLIVCALFVLTGGLSGCGGNGLASALGLTTISSYSPSTGSPGTVVTVNGTNLGGSGAVVLINAVVIGNVTGSSTSIQFTIPTNAPVGSDTITVNGETAGTFTNS